MRTAMKARERRAKGRGRVMSRQAAVSAVSSQPFRSATAIGRQHFIPAAQGQRGEWTDAKDWTLRHATTLTLTLSLPKGEGTREPLPSEGRREQESGMG